MKKVLATMLALIMALALCTIGWAVGQEDAVASITDDDSVVHYYATIGDALKELKPEQTLTLEKDMTETLTVSVPCSINLNGHKIVSANGPAVKVEIREEYEDAITVWILDSSDDGNGEIESKTDSAVVVSSLKTPCSVQVDVSVKSAAEKAHVALQNGAFIDCQNYDSKAAALALIGSNAVTAGVIYGEYDGNVCFFGTGSLEQALYYAAEIRYAEKVSLYKDAVVNYDIPLVELTVENGATLTINGGNCDAELKTEGTGKIVVTGGTFSDSNVSNYVGERPVALLEDEDVYIIGTAAINEAAKAGNDVRIIQGTIELTDVPAGVTIHPGNGTVKVNGKDITEYGDGYTVPSAPKYYYTKPSVDTTPDTTKGSPKTFDAGVGIYAMTAVLSLTGMAWTAKKRH